MTPSPNSTAVAERVRKSFHEQAQLCEQFGSTFTAALIRAIERALDEKSETGRRVLAWTGAPEAKHDALALRLAGGLHALVLNGASPLLAHHYALACPDKASAVGAGPYSPDNKGELAAAVAQAIALHDTQLLRWLDLPPQTNEVGRAAVLYLGLMTVAQQTGLPIRLFEIGASAGLNLLLDHYAHDLGGVCGGDRHSRIKLAPEWSGAPPTPLPLPTIIARRGCDLSPIDITAESDRLRLRAYVWPDQPHRLHRLEKALDIARAVPPPIDRADAGAWIQEQIRRARPAGSATVLMHSLVFGYFPADLQAKITAYIEELGAQADAQAPLAWLAYELNSANETELTLRLWARRIGPEKTRQAGETIRLARAHPHGRWIVSESDPKTPSLPTA